MSMSSGLLVFAAFSATLLTRIAAEAVSPVPLTVEELKEETIADSVWEAMSDYLVEAAYTVGAFLLISVIGFPRANRSGSRSATKFCKIGDDVDLIALAKKQNKCAVGSESPIRTRSARELASRQQSPGQAQPRDAAATDPGRALPRSRSAGPPRTGSRASPGEETDALALAVRCGKAANLPQLLDAANARAIAKAGCDQTAEAIVNRHLICSLRACGARHCFREGLAAYDHVANRLGSGSGSVYSLLLYCAVEAKELHRCPAFFARLCAHTDPSGHDFVNMVRHFVHRQDAKGLAKMLEDLRSRGFAVDVVSRNRALAVCTSNRSLDLAEVLVVQPSGPPMDAVAYNTLMKGYALGRFSDRCFELYSQMRSQGLVPTEVTFGILLDACIDAKEFEHAKSVFRDLQNSGIGLNVVHYTTFIKGLVQAGHLEDAMGVLDEMQRSLGTVPDLVTYSTLVKAHADRGNIGEAVDLVEQLLKQGIQPDAIVFNILLTGCCVKALEPSRIFHVFHWLVRHGLEPSTTSMSILVKALSKSEAWDEALDLLEYSGHRYGVWPEARLFAQLAQASSKAERGDHVMRTYAAMVKSAGRCNKVVDDANSTRMLRLCTSSGQAKAASLLHHALVRSGGRMTPEEVDRLLA